MEPIAIIGLGCRFPSAEDPKSFWNILRNGVDAITEVPSQRWDIDAFYNATPATPGKMNTRWGGFLKQVDCFDPAFFGISAREAERIDPQQRLALEVTWESLENAGIAASKLSGSQTGVFIGVANYDYGLLLGNSPDCNRISAYDGTGSILCVVANRISYSLNLRGPSMAIGTACSSSLVALHLACQSLQRAETDLCIAGGVNLILSPEPTISCCQALMLSGDGRCKTFDARANGYVRGEGCGIVVLKRLSDALRDRNNIQAIIRGSAVNQDGLSNGLTAPNGPSQQAVIRQALRNAGVTSAQISYVETHGTGTSLGDPIEINSLKTVLMEGRQQNQLCWLGSVKTNIGHLEAAAGISGVIKVVLSLQNQEIPPHLHLQQLNPYIKIKNTPLSIPTTLQKWLQGKEKRIAGVSSFGFGGTNCHVIIEEASPETNNLISTSQNPESIERPLHLLTLSAKNENALQELAQKYQQFVGSNADKSLADICFTASTGRSHFDHRLAIIAASPQQLSEQLIAFGKGHKNSALISGTAERQQQKIAFLFTGQGSQYVNMGRSLYETQPTFQDTINLCNEILSAYLEKSLLSVLYPESGESSPLNQTAYTQPALFVLEYALAQMWQSWGVEPAAVMGHSVGEYVAACVAGILTLEDGLKLIAARGQFMQNLPSTGEMVAVLASEAEIRENVEINQNHVAIAAYNSPSNTVISGEQQSIREICTTLEAKGIKTKKLQTSHAFHSPLMEPILSEFRQVAATINYGQPKIDFISNVTGHKLTSELITPDYWCDHLRSPVKFASGLQTLYASGWKRFVEIGPKPTLLAMGRSSLPNEDCIWLPSLRPNCEDWQQILHSLGKLYASGLTIDWSSFYRHEQRSCLALPTYPFQRQRYWVETTKDRHKITESSPEKSQTPIINLLTQGNTEQLVQLLAKTGKFSEEKIELLPELVAAIVKRHQEQLTISSIKDYFYQIEWQFQPRRVTASSETTQLSEPSCWLIFADLRGTGQALAKLLQARGENCILVYSSDKYQQKETNVWSINPTNPNDFKRLLTEVSATNVMPLTRVIYLWSLAADNVSELTISSLETAQQLGCGSVLYLMQALSEQNWSVPPRLWLVTQEAMPVNNCLPRVAQAPLWGLGKVIALEHPEFWGGMIDLEAEATEDEAELLFAEIEDSQGEDGIVLRERKRYVARLVASSLPETQGVEISSDRTYLITGGLGALGLQLCQWIVGQGAKYLVLTGRSGASASVQETLRPLEQAGVKILIAQADVSCQEDMLALLETIQVSMPPLRGIIHAAGVFEYQALKDIQFASFAEVLRPKVRGAWILHQLTQEIKLDFFVNFSSIASVWGSKGQAHYAAANQFLDVLAHYRRQLGLPALSVNWGPWAGGGMAIPEFQTWLNRMGIQALQPEQATAALGYLLSTKCLQATVANVDWTVLKALYEAKGKRSLLEHISVQPPEKTQKYSGQDSEILQRLQRSPENQHLDILLAYLQQHITQLLGSSSSLTLDSQQHLLALGLDSLMAIQLRNTITDELKITLPVEKFVDGSSSIAHLANLLLEELALINQVSLVSSYSEKNSLNKMNPSLDNQSTLSKFALSTVTSNPNNWVEGEL